jgi:glycosyltransferase involved in cell wall biosynthesis
MKKVNRPSISIIVPVYKTEAYLSRCLDSLISQTFDAIEIICVVGISPDNSLAICETYAERDTRITVISQIPQGLSAARNEGLSHAKGLYIQFCYGRMGLRFFSHLKGVILLYQHQRKGFI